MSGPSLVAIWESNWVYDRFTLRLSVYRQLHTTVDSWLSEQMKDIGSTKQLKSSILLWYFAAAYLLNPNID